MGYSSEIGTVVFKYINSRHHKTSLNYLLDRASKLGLELIGQWIVYM